MLPINPIRPGATAHPPAGLLSLRIGIDLLRRSGAVLVTDGAGRRRDPDLPSWSAFVLCVVAIERSGTDLVSRTVELARLVISGEMTICVAAVEVRCQGLAAVEFVARRAGPARGRQPGAGPW
jgi:hypothetical protein